MVQQRRQTTLKKTDASKVPAHSAGESSRRGLSASRLQEVGGSLDDRFNSQIANAALGASWFPQSVPDEARDKLVSAVIGGLTAFRPADEIEGMIAVQAVAMHHAAMECARRAMIPDQPFEIAQGYRKAAANSSRTFIELLGALDRKRGKGTKQVVRVERVTVQPGGQAVVGIVTPGAAGGGVGNAGQIEEQPRASPARLAHDATLGSVLPPLRSADPERKCVPVARDAEWPLPDARRQEHGPADG